MLWRRTEKFTISETLRLVPQGSCVPPESVIAGEAIVEDDVPHHFCFILLNYSFYLNAKCF